MNDHIPSTDQVKLAFQIHQHSLGFFPKEESGQRFREWLNGLLARAWEDGMNTGVGWWSVAQHGSDFAHPENPYAGDDE